jgi:hypothetical protein
LAVTSLQSIILTLAVAYAVIGALLLIVLVYARLHWSLKAVVIVVTSAFYFVSFGGMRGLLGWASAEKLPANFKLLSTRIVEPHSLEGDPGSIYLWVEELDEDNRPSAVPRAFRIPYSEALAEQTHTRRQRDQGRAPARRPGGGFRRRRRHHHGLRQGVHHAEDDPGDIRRRFHDRDVRGPAGGCPGIGLHAAAAPADAAEGCAAIGPCRK